MNSQLSLFSIPTPQDISFLAVCRETAEKCGLRKVPQSEIDERVRLSEIEYNKLLKEVDER